MRLSSIEIGIADAASPLDKASVSLGSRELLLEDPKRESSLGLDSRVFYNTTILMTTKISRSQNATIGRAKHYFCLAKDFRLGCGIRRTLLVGSALRQAAEARADRQEDQGWE